MRHPDVDVDERPDWLIVEARLAGVAPEEVAVDVSKRELVIRTLPAADGPVRRYADFVYRLSLPSDVDVDRVDATMDHGLLVVRVPRLGGSGPVRRVAVTRPERVPADAYHEPMAESYDAAAGPTYEEPVGAESMLGP